MRELAAAIATAELVLEVWDRETRRDLHLTLPAATGPKSFAQNFINGLVEKDPNAEVEESEHRVTGS